MALSRPSTTKKSSEEIVDAEVVDTQIPEGGAESIAEEAAAEEAVVEETAVAEEVEVKEDPAASSSTAVATTAGSVPSIQEARVSGMKKFQNDMAEQGYEGLELDGMSFDRIKLHEGQFKLGTDEEELGQSFQCVVEGTRPIYIVKQHSGEDAELFYSYDPKGKTLSNGESAEDKLAEWLDDGYGDEENPLDIKQYLEAQVSLLDDSGNLGDMAILSIPPTSRSRLSGAVATAVRRYKCLPAEVIIECQVGKKVGEGTKAFRPWVFKAVGKL